MILPNDPDPVPFLSGDMSALYKCAREKAIEMEGEGKTIQEIGPYVAGAKGKVVYETGDLEHGIWSAGTCMGLINDIPTCKELVERIVSEAEEMIRGKLAKAIAA